MTYPKLLLTAVAAALAASSAHARPMSATDMHSMHRIGSPDVSPDGRTAVFTISTTATTLYGEKLIDPLKPLLIMPEVTDATKWKQGKIWFADPEERFVARAFSSVATLLFINTDQVKPEEVRTAKDLLNAKWRGKISTEDPTTTGSGANAAARLPPALSPPTARRATSMPSADAWLASQTSDA